MAAENGVFVEDDPIPSLKARFLSVCQEIVENSADISDELDDRVDRIIESTRTSLRLSRFDFKVVKSPGQE